MKKIGLTLTAEEINLLKASLSDSLDALGCRLHPHAQELADGERALILQRAEAINNLFFKLDDIKFLTVTKL